MAKKEITQEDLIKKAYSKLELMNKKLRYICECYYISYDGTIYMKSLVPFVEKIAIIKDTSLIEPFLGCAIPPNGLFEASKELKKKKLTIKIEDSCYTFGQDDSDYTFKIYKANPDKDSDAEYINKMILNKFYKRFFMIQYPPYKVYSKNTFIDLSEDDIEDLASAKPLYIQYNNTTITLTKHLMLDIGKHDKVSYSRVSYIGINKDESQKRVFYKLRQEEEYYTCDTIFNTLQS